ncbi:MAG: glycosyltransferase family 2 protein [Spirochaetales bacterium]|nr:glycosyltransferase family 2 protein [Spirochaetales bacterium]
MFKINTLDNSQQCNKHIRFSIIIPARNEEKNIKRLLETIKAQKIQPHEVIVVDDCSDDKTAEIAAHNDARVIILKELPYKWTGKNWACYNGAQSAQNDLLLFLDADVEIEPGGLERIISSYKNNPGTVTIQPFHKIKKLYEQFSLFLNIVLTGGFGAFTIFGKKIKPAGLFGPCILIDKKTYLNSFTRKEIKNNIMENLKLGQYLIERNEKIKYYCGKNSFSFRMYPGGLKHLIQGWSKGFFSGSRATFLPLLIMIILWISGSVGAVRLGIIHSLSFNILTFSLSLTLYLLYSVQIYWMARKVGNFHFLTALFYPAPLLFFFFVYAKSFYHSIIQGKASWKDRKITVKK